MYLSFKLIPLPRVYASSYRTLTLALHIVDTFGWGAPSLTHLIHAYLPLF